MNLSEALRIQPGAVVTFTGAGGKTTAMRRLGQELAAAGLRVLATTTTRLGIDQLHDFPGFLIQPERPAIAAALAQTRCLLLVAGLDTSQGKALGLAADEIEAYRDLADVVLVEGDGSRGLPLKAPGPGEPVTPASTTHLVCCAGVGALGQPLSPETVHRPEIFSQLAGLAPGQTITPAALARLLLHPDGPARGAPAGCERYLLLNGCDAVTPATLADLRGLAARLAAHPDFAAVLLGQVAQEPPVLAAYGKTTAIVLAAGGSTRFGSAKQLHPWQGQPLLRHVVLQALAAPASRVSVVVGAHFEEVVKTLHGLPVRVIYNPDWRQGQSSSVQAGLRALAPDTKAALFILGDQPHLPPELLAGLIDRHRQTLAPVVAPRHQGRRGNPALFDRACFAELMALSGDTGGRALFERYQDRIAWLEAGPEVLVDLDRPQDATHPI